ncbi:extracellular solute-binding protein [bacterium]|nr:extracellular solute-binding protein [bacterium]
MNNKKGPVIVLLFLGVVVIVVVIALLVSRFLSGNTGSTNGKVELNYIGLWDQKEIYEPLIAEYQAQNPNVSITYTKASFINQSGLTYKGVYQTDAEERIANGSVDIIRVHQTWIAKLLPSLVAAPTSILTGAQAKELYYPAIYEAITTSNNLVYGSPQIIDGLVLLYNKDIFDKANITDPRTATKDWDVTLQTALKLSQKNANGTIKIAGINMGSFSNVRSSPEIILTMMTQSAVPVVTVDPSTAKISASFATPQGLAAINRFYEFSKLGAWSSRMEDDLQAFSSGRLAMMIAPSWRIIDLVGMNSSLRFEALPLPVLPGANPDVPQYLGSFWIDVVSKKSKHPEEAWAFLKWLSEPEQMRRIYKAQTEKRLIGNPYPRKDMADEQKDAPYIGPILEMAPKMKSWPLYDYGIWEETLRKELLASEERGSVSADDLQSIQTRINNLTLKR